MSVHSQDMTTSGEEPNHLWSVEKQGKLEQVLYQCESTLNRHVLKDKLDTNGTPQPSTSEVDILEQAENLSAIVKKVVHLFQQQNKVIRSMKHENSLSHDQYSNTFKETDAKIKGLERELYEANGRASDLQQLLEDSNRNLGEERRINRVLVLENALAVEQLRKLNISGVSIPEIDLPVHVDSDSSVKVLPLDPTSREAHFVASPIAQSKSIDEWDVSSSPDLSIKKTKSYDDQNKLLRKYRRKLNLVDQPSFTPVAKNSKNRSEAVDALVKDLMTRLQISGFNIEFKKLGAFQYRIENKVFQIKVLNGRLFTRMGGGYHELIDIIRKMRLDCKEVSVLG